MADDKFILKCPEDFIRIKNPQDGTEKKFSEISFDGTKIIDVLKVLGFKLD